jgi:1-acyl-sn-glycerol-3-phosphate acyltransferase
MTLSRRFILALFRLVTGTMFRIHADALVKVPQEGPLIIMVNHVNIWEIPIIYWKLQPRPVHGLVAAERWKNKIFAWGLNVCGAIPIDRGGTNLDSFRKAREVLERGEIIIIAPEGTRSGDGQLQRGRPGVVLLAMFSQAPILPVVFYGHEKYRANLRKLCRTDLYFEVGEPFFLEADLQMDHSMRQEKADEIMLRLAQILPEGYRGYYASQARKNGRP